ncbi:MAG: transglutaminaseTgpA domain-containing protein [Gaiellales bacterium]
MARPDLNRFTPGRIAAAALTTGFLLFGGWHWTRLEQPHMGGRELLLLAVLGAVPTVVALIGGSRLTTLVSIVAVTVVAIGHITHTWPWESRHGIYPERVGALVEKGLRDWFGTHTPIDAGRFPGADHDLRLAFFAAAAALAWLMVRRGSALPGIGVAFALFALPSTVLPLHSDAFRAGVFLLLALLTLVATSARDGRRLAGDAQVVGLSVAVVVAGLVVGTAPGVTKSAFLQWQTWNPLAHNGPLVNVDFMWNQTYTPLRWPKKRTQVLEVTSPTPMYWKAATLSTFLIDHWQFSNEDRLVASASDGSLQVPPADLPLEESVGHHVITVKVKVLGLADDHLIGAGQPVRWNLPGGMESLLSSDGTVTTLADLPRNASYSVRVYDPTPTPAELNSVSPDFPESIRAGLNVSNVTIPAWPRKLPRAVKPLAPAFMAASNQAWVNSKASSAKNEYEVVLGLEHYFRSKPFRYTLTPDLSGPLPALAEFMLHTHQGYCQMFSGAMALVLRLHGIPARIAVGFTPGKLHSADSYLVNDRDAHAWVEVYFPGYGWLPFEPTPGAHVPTDTSTSSAGFAKIRTGGGIPPGLKKYLGLALPTAGGKKSIPTTGRGAVEQVGGAIGRGLAGGGGSGHGRFLTWLFTIVVVVLVAVLILKVAGVRWRYLRRGPRAQAAAAYHDLVTFVGDQGLEVRPDDTFDDLAERVQRTFGVDAAAFASSATRARYAPLPLAERESRLLRRELRAVKRDVRKRLTARERATGALRLRSLLAQATLGG